MTRRCAWFCLALILGPVSLLGAQTRLPEMTAAARTPCQVHPEAGAATADLWFDARSALESTGATDSAPPTLLIQSWRRNLSSNLRLRWEQRDTSRVKTRSPFSERTPGNLERSGYIQWRWNGFIYYGPGADLLLSERFLKTGRDGTAGLVGLAFEPLPSQNLPDVAGILWIDPAERLLRHLEYTWINPPLEARAPALGGRADFVRLADGGWIIQRWNIRMPRPSDAPGTGYGGYTDQGGEVLAVGARRPRRQ
jgi:hypothetical protein